MNKITLITPLSPTSHYAKYFHETIESVLSQEQINWEWIIGLDLSNYSVNNDFTKDLEKDRITNNNIWQKIEKIINPKYNNTKELLEEAKKTKRIKFLPVNGGTAAARHAAIIYSNTNLIRNLDADDTLNTKNALKDTYNSLTKHDVITHSFSQTLDIVMDHNDKIKKSYYYIPPELIGTHEPQWLLKQWKKLPIHINPIHLNTLAIKKNEYFKVGGYSPIQRGQDLLLAKNLSINGHVHISKTPQSTYRIWEGSVTNGAKPPKNNPLSEKWIKIIKN